MYNIIRHIYYFIKKLYFCLLFYYFKKNNKQKLTIFLFHDVTDYPSEFAKQFNLYVTKRTFEKQIYWIKNNYTIINPEDLLYSRNFPNNSALITFDDGFKGAFLNGIKYLSINKIPSLMFLNMENILNNKPIISSTISFLSLYSNDFKDFNLTNKIDKPYHLTYNPELFKLATNKHSNFNYNDIIDYQGEIANFEIVNEFSNNNYVYYGNHLYEHWNSAQLKSIDFETLYKKNEIELKFFKNYINIFAFPNGQPKTCFNFLNLLSLFNLGVKIILYSSGGLNHNTNSFIYNRVALSENENNKLNFYSRISQGFFINDLFKIFNFN
jgi:peptidoglycan/xylan/chitin deacetylase (PgdA/CDA1 family)